MLSDREVLIAGTEPITENVLKKSKKLKFISRVGVGLDSINLLEAKKRGIKISFTPDAPSAAVAELTIGLILSQLRHIHIADKNMHSKIWQKNTGRRLGECNVGLIGTGRIGRQVLALLYSFRPNKIFLHDVNESEDIATKYNAEYVSKDDILEKCDVISLHIPLNNNTFHMVNEEELHKMKSDAIIVNTSRGPIINEKALYEALMTKEIGGAAIDVYDKEPYEGKLTNVDNCLLTPHIGPMSMDCRSKMEMEAVQEVIRYYKGENLQRLVPDSEYKLRENI